MDFLDPLEWAITRVMGVPEPKWQAKAKGLHNFTQYVAIVLGDTTGYETVHGSFLANNEGGPSLLKASYGTKEIQSLHPGATLAELKTRVIEDMQAAPDYADSFYEVIVIAGLPEILMGKSAEQVKAGLLDIYNAVTMAGWSPMAVSLPELKKTQLPAEVRKELNKVNTWLVYGDPANGTFECGDFHGFDVEAGIDRPEDWNSFAGSLTSQLSEYFEWNLQLQMWE